MFFCSWGGPILQPENTDRPDQTFYNSVRSVFTSWPLTVQSSDPSRDGGPGDDGDGGGGWGGDGVRVGDGGDGGHATTGRDRISQITGAEFVLYSQDISVSL